MQFRDLEAVLAHLIGVFPAKRPRFQARLKQLQRMGFPVGINVGKAARTEYTVEHLAQLAIVLELLQTGITPERAISFVRSWWDEIRRGLIAVKALDKVVGIAFAPKDFGGLQSSTSADDGDDKIAWTANGCSLIAVDFDDNNDFYSTARDLMLNSARTVILNLSSIWDMLFKGYAENDLDTLELDQALVAWASEKDRFNRLIGEGLNLNDLDPQT